MKSLRDYIIEANVSVFDPVKSIRKNCPIKGLKTAEKLFRDGRYDKRTLYTYIPVKKSKHNKQTEVETVFQCVELDGTIYYKVKFDVPDISNSLFYLTSLNNIDKLANYAANPYDEEAVSNMGEDGELHLATQRTYKPIPKIVQKDIVTDKRLQDKIWGVLYSEGYIFEA